MLIPQDTTIFETDNSKVIYQENFIDLDEEKALFEYFLEEILWKSDTAKIYGKIIITKRQIAWFADTGLDYNYSGTNRVADGKWDKKVLQIKQKLQNQTKHKFNSCLLNFYPTGNQGMAFHSDDQNHLEPKSTVAIVSFGVERFLKFRPNPKLKNVTEPDLSSYKILLQKGSLVLMLGETQKYWQHEIPKMAAIKNPRISLTFRNMLKDNVKINNKLD